MIYQRVSSGHQGSIGSIIPHIVQTACAYQSSISFEVNEKRVNAKSIMGVMALASQNVPEIQVYVDGADEEDALRAMTGLLS
ncbi:MAG: HPr family phosphocarrier protein [Lachnospiraceae bacterium]|nr:HPr family phosphocarrier protein [Lachnospiraceae bacterium]